MTATTYRQCYQVLHVVSGCGWTELRLAYRRRVRLCHPDRREANAPDGAMRDDEFKQVVKAYRELAAFYRSHGELPPPWLGITGDAGMASASDRNVTVHEPGAGTDDRKTSARPAARSRFFTWRPSRFHGAVFTAFVLGVGSSALVGQIGQGIETTSTPRHPDARISIGMDPQSVVDVQGVPNYTKGSVWFYGESGVIFERGCVIGWENQPPFPLRTLSGVPYLSRGVTRERESCTPPVN